MKWLVLLLIAVPALELALLLWATTNIGFFVTLALIIATGFIGAYLAKKQGVKAIRDIQAGLNNFQPPGDKLLNAAFVLVGGVLLLTPGFITDIAGFSMLFTPSQKIYKPAVYKWIQKKTKKSRVIIE